jgi:integrase
MKVRYDLLFDFKKDIEKKGKEKGLVQIRAYHEGGRRYFTTKYYLYPKEWDFKANSAKEPYTAKIFRDHISKLENFETQFRLLNNKFHLNDFDEFLKPKDVELPVYIISFTDFFKLQISKETQLSFVTQRSELNTFNKIKVFRNKIEFEDLNFSFIQDLDRYLRVTLKLKINTVEKYHRQLRKYINLAIKQDYMEENKNPYRTFKLHTEQTDTLFLLPEETNRIEELIFDENLAAHNELEKARDMFLFGCFTGLRFSDCFALRKENFKQTEEGLIMEFRAQKTNKLATRPLYLLFDGKPEKIVLKYLKLANNKLLFFGMNNPKVNKCLKRIAVMAQVNRGLYFKASRDTFGTTLYILSGNDKLVQKQLQHSKRDQTDKYVHLVDQIENAELRKAFPSKFNI